MQYVLAGLALVLAGAVGRIGHLARKHRSSKDEPTA